LDVLQQLQVFCRNRRVGGQVSFTGGNPFLHPNFFEFYQAATDLGFGTVVLGNPVAEEKLEKLVAIGTPLYYQVSLEGLEEHNDHIRGPGNYRRVLSFLETLGQFRIPAMVMLTLTRANLRQVLPLAEVLRPLADGFNFNRLALFGEGAQLELPEVEEYRYFLSEYLDAMAHNPVLSLKDNLFNILLDQQGLEPSGGCTGFGCGAAFNFLALLSDGEVHACRKMPSLIGNLKEARLEELYESAAAQKYRRGCAACRDCPLHPTCGGCLAVTASLGGNPFTDRDPFCFRQNC
jgi:selenobiotic family peptide radical SAM maturase